MGADRGRRNRPTPKHAFGYTKAEYFSSGVEGFLIIAAAAGIVVAAWERWQIAAARSTDAWLGVGVSAAASAINGSVAVMLLRARDGACGRSR